MILCFFLVCPIYLCVAALSACIMLQCMAHLLYVQVTHLSKQNYLGSYAMQACLTLQQPWQDYLWQLALPAFNYSPSIFMFETFWV